jgi:hypothetical protein
MDTRDLVIAACYARAAELSWDSLSQQQRSMAYDAWLDDAKIGKLLTPFLSREKARVWLKDVPMKEYSRAVSGIGTYARFAPLQLPGPDLLAQQVFGSSWVADPHTLRTKPNRVVITDGSVDRLMLWGRPRALRDLMWAAMVALVDDAANPVVVLCSTRSVHLTDAERKRHIALGDLVGIVIVHTDVTLRSVQTQEDGGS